MGKVNLNTPSTQSINRAKSQKPFQTGYKETLVKIPSVHGTTTSNFDIIRETTGGVYDNKMKSPTFCAGTITTQKFTDGTFWKTEHLKTGFTSGDDSSKIKISYHEKNGKVIYTQPWLKARAAAKCETKTNY